MECECEYFIREELYNILCYWTGLGPLIHLTGPIGPQVVGLPSQSVVKDALRGNTWWLSLSRSRNPIISLIKNILPDCGSMVDCEQDDVYLWKQDHHSPSNIFSAAKTWLALHPCGVPVSWHKSVWFKDRIPKHAFISWVVTWNRLHTRDRLRSWGLGIPPDCVLCNGHHESRDHLFFECSYSQAVWGHFTARMHLTPPPLFMTCLLWINSATRDKSLALIIKLLFQASIYLVWKERNLRIHSPNLTPSSVLIKEIKQILRARLDPLSRNQLHVSPGSSPLATWFRFFD
ncbi:putative reverse transcriptase zinc-binding domain-containing protein [Arabidopsis thaliana]